MLNAISPHRDDVALSLARTILELKSVGVFVNLVSCFTRTNWAPLSGASSVENVSALRRNEDLAFVKVLDGSASFPLLAYGGGCVAAVYQTEARKVILRVLRDGGSKGDRRDRR